MISIWSGLVVQVVSTLLRGNWQDFNWHDASRGPSAIAELLVFRRLRSPLVKIFQKQTPKQNLLVVVVLVDVVDGSVTQQYRSHNINRLTVWWWFGWSTSSRVGTEVGYHLTIHALTQPTEIDRPSSGRHIKLGLYPPPKKKRRAWDRTKPGLEKNIRF